MASDRTYNGYKNYETWAVNLWIDNDQGMADELQDMAHHAKNVHALADAIKGWIEDMNPLSGQASLWSDLMNGALSEVDWHELAENALEGFEEEEETEDVEDDYSYDAEYVASEN